MNERRNRTPNIAKAIAVCPYRGVELRREVCGPCHGVQIKIFHCSEHGECTIAKALPGIHVCDGGLQPFNLKGTRHFLYHIAAFNRSNVWRRNVDHVLRRLWLFNGKRVVAIADGPDMVSPDEVVAAFRGEVDTFVVPNNPQIREVATFVPLLAQVQSYESDITFYAHAKGVTRADNEGETHPHWTSILYETNLDYFPVVFDLLQRHPMAGAFKKVGHGFRGSQSTWHYSGTYYWFRNRDVFSRQWQSIDQKWWGTESWPGIMFRSDDAGCIFHSGRVSSLDLYSMRYLTQTVLPELEIWRKDHEQQRLTQETVHK